MTFFPNVAEHLYWLIMAAITDDFPDLGRKIDSGLTRHELCDYGTHIGDRPVTLRHYLAPGSFNITGSIYLANGRVTVCRSKFEWGKATIWFPPPVPTDEQLVELRLMFDMEEAFARDLAGVIPSACGH